VSNHYQSTLCKCRLNSAIETYFLSEVDRQHFLDFGPADGAVGGHIFRAAITKGSMAAGIAVGGDLVLHAYAALVDHNH